VRVIGLERFGGPEVLAVFDVPVPKPGPGEVVIRVKAIGVNPTDVLFREGRLHPALPTGLPAVPGRDLAGSIVSVGSGAALPLGAAVMATIDPRLGQGAYAEYVVLPERLVVRIPVGVSLEEAASLPTCGVTALLALEALQVCGDDDVIAVTGATGGVGGSVLQLARQCGVKTIAVCRQEYATRASDLGASWVADVSRDPVREILRIAPGGIAGVVDCSSVGQSLVPAIADDGVFAILRDLTVVVERGIDLRRIRISEFDPVHLLERVGEAVGAGALKPRVALALPLEQARHAHELLARGGLDGRMVLIA